MKAVLSIQNLTLILLVFLLGTGCVVDRSLVTGKKRAYGYSWQQEVQIGQEADQSIIQQYGLYDDSALEKYVSDLGQELLAVSHLRREDTPAEMKSTPFTFRLLDSPVVNAFALPGGYVYITRGLLAHLDNQAQLAVVLGHEIGHVVGRHASIRAANQNFGQAGLIGVAIGAQAGLGGNAAEQVLGVGGNLAGLMFLKYGRDDERESDRLGVEYGALEGYDSTEGAEFFRSLKRMSEKAGQSIPSFMSTHPDPGERENTIIRLSNDLKTKVANKMNRVEEAAYKTKIDNIIVGEDPRQGYVENGMFYHPVLKFQFPVPNEYTLINQPTQVALVENNQKAIMVFQIASEVNSASEAGTKFASQEGITVISQQATRINGLTAYDVAATALDEQGAEFKLAARYIEHSGNVYSFLAYTNASAYDTYSRGFNNTLDGFRNLTDQGKINVLPSRLDVITTTRAGTLESFLPAKLPRGFELLDVAILNQMEPNESLPRGTKLKIPR